MQSRVKGLWVAAGCGASLVLLLLVVFALVVVRPIVSQGRADSREFQAAMEQAYASLQGRYPDETIQLYVEARIEVRAVYVVLVRSRRAQLDVEGRQVFARTILQSVCAQLASGKAYITYYVVFAAEPVAFPVEISTDIDYIAMPVDDLDCSENGSVLSPNPQNRPRLSYATELRSHES